MAQYEVDLPHARASRFDSVLSRYLSDELASRDGVDVRVTAYSPRVGVERRLVFMSCSVSLEAFCDSWLKATSALDADSAQRPLASLTTS